MSEQQIFLWGFERDVPYDWLSEYVLHRLDQPRWPAWDPVLVRFNYRHSFMAAVTQYPAASGYSPVAILCTKNHAQDMAAASVAFFFDRVIHEGDRATLEQIMQSPLQFQAERYIDDIAPARIAWLSAQTHRLDLLDLGLSHEAIECIETDSNTRHAFEVAIWHRIRIFRALINAGWRNSSA